MNIIVEFVRTAYSTLQEIFDESPYRRFLAHHGDERSGDSYAEFLREKHGGTTPKRCC